MIANRTAGAVVFLFTDIEGSTRLWEQEPTRMPGALRRHDALARAAVEEHRGVVVKTIGDGVHAVFTDALDAVSACVALQRALSDPAGTEGVALRVRCGIHAGPVERRDNDFFGSVVNRAARIMSVAHGGQVLLSQAVAEAVAERLPQPVALRDLGTVRLRDLARPERVYQVTHPALRADFPALRSLEATPNNLPQQVTSFVGRERAVAETKKALAATRLLTLVGVGGLGKSRLALQIAADVLDDYPDGVWLVELAPVADPQLVAQAVAAVLGIKEQAGGSVQDALLAHVKERSLLVILDNCEHVIEACAVLAERLLRGSVALKVLASSREPLRIGGETVYAVPALTLPQPDAAPGVDALLQCEAVRLFVERAAAVHPPFAAGASNARALADICRCLDGIPLAIELAAARVGTLTVERIAERLGDRFALLTRGARTALPRQQTLRAMIDWSYDLLGAAERALFMRLSVFAGGFVLEAAESVGPGEAVATTDVVDVLGALVDKSLVELDADGARYRLLETVRQYARDRLGESGAQAHWQARHFAWCLALCEAAEPHLVGAAQQTWLERLAAEHDNLRAALTWSTANDGAGALRLAAALWLFWYVRGYVTEGRGWLAAALDAAAAADAPALRARALRGAGVMAYHQGDYVASQACHQACMTIHQAQGDRRGIAGALGSLGIVAYDLGDYAAARSLQEQGLAIQRELGDRRGIAMSLNNLGAIACDQGEFDAARPLHEESLAIKRELGDRRGIAMSLNNLGDVASHQGEHATARALYGESLAIRRELGDQWGIAMSLNNLGDVARELADYAAARTLHTDCLAIRRTLGDRRGIADSLEALAYLATASSQALRAARIFGAAGALRERISAPLPASERARYDRHVAAARADLGNDAFDTAWREGRSLGLEEAMRCASDHSDA